MGYLIFDAKWLEIFILLNLKCVIANQEPSMFVFNFFKQEKYTVHNTVGQISIL